MSSTDEQEIIQVLRNLPIAIIVTPRANGYTWQCIEGNGTGPTLASVIASSVSYLTGRIAHNTNVIDDLRLAHLREREN